jgi:hypothetical protein
VQKLWRHFLFSLVCQLATNAKKKTLFLNFHFNYFALSNFKGRVKEKVRRKERKREREREREKEKAKER